MTFIKVCVKLENSYSGRVIYKDYPLSILLIYSKRANRELKEINKTGEFVLHTCDTTTEPMADGVQIVLHWLHFVHFRIGGINKTSQLTWQIASSLSGHTRGSGFPISIAKVLRVQEAFHLIGLGGGIAPQNDLKAQIAFNFMYRTIAPEDLAALFYLLAPLDPVYTDFVMTLVAKRIWNNKTWPQFEPLWYSVTCDQRLYECMTDCAARLLAANQAETFIKNASWAPRELKKGCEKHFMLRA